MATNRKKIVLKQWSEKDIEDAFLEVDAGKSIRKTAEKYGTSEGTLRYRINMTKKGKALLARLGPGTNYP